MKSVSEIIRQLKENNPEALADIKKIDLTDIDLVGIDAMASPSKIKKLSDAIRIKRLNGAPLEKEELKDLMRRIGK